MSAMYFALRGFLFLVSALAGVYLGYIETHIANPNDRTRAERLRWRSRSPRVLRWLL